MDTFKMPKLEKEDPESLTLEKAIERKKFYDCAQLDCLPRHLGKAIALKNYWVYRYDIV